MHPGAQKFLENKGTKVGKKRTEEKKEISSPPNLPGGKKMRVWMQLKLALQGGDYLLGPYSILLEGMHLRPYQSGINSFSSRQHWKKKKGSRCRRLRCCRAPNSHPPLLVI